MKENLAYLKELTRLIRYYILTSTTSAGSGHPTTSLSATELMTVLFFGGFYHYDLKNPDNLRNDRVIFSKGHASPLLYSLYCAAGAISYEELLTLRKKGSRLEGHPTPEFPYAEAATGSLGQGLSIGLGMALAGAPHVYVLLGDGEMAEGNVWEALEVGGYYKTSNLTAVLDVNRLAQSGETMLGWDIKNYQKRVESFGWEAILVEDGHNLEEIYKAFLKIKEPHSARQRRTSRGKPQMIIAKTIKGKGVSFLENKEGWHGKALDEKQLEQALKELGEVDLKIRGKII